MAPIHQDDSSETLGLCFIVPSGVSLPPPTPGGSRKLRFLAPHIVNLNKINMEVVVVGGRDWVGGRKTVVTAAA